jgi:hypothetical protein
MSRYEGPTNSAIPAGGEVAGPKREEAVEMSMLETAVTSSEDFERKQKWDSFLDAYSLWLKDPSLINAAALHLAGVAVATSDGTFSLEAFESRLGWDLNLDPAKLDSA